MNAYLFSTMFKEQEPRQEQRGSVANPALITD
jgi:hypothetical protein